MASGNFPHRDSKLTAVALAYVNKKYIADQVLPYVQVPSSEFLHNVYPKAETIRLVDDTFGPKSRSRQVEFQATETPNRTKMHGLHAMVTQHDIDNAAEGFDPRMTTVEGLKALMLLQREKRVADIVFGAGTYGGSNKTTLVGNDQWSAPTTSTPKDDIETAIDGLFYRPNIAVMGHAVWSQLRKHPQIVEAIFGSTAGNRNASREEFAALFELDALLVGEAWGSASKIPGTPSEARLWGKHFALLHRDLQATPQFGVTFGFTARFGSMVAKSKFDDEIGVRGAYRVEIAEESNEIIVAPDLGYLFINAVA